MTMNLTVPCWKSRFLEFYDIYKKSKTLNMSFCNASLSQEKSYID